MFSSLQGREGGISSNSTLVVPISGHHDVSTLSPISSPTEE